MVGIYLSFELVYAFNHSIINFVYATIHTTDVTFSSILHLINWKIMPNSRTGTVKRPKVKKKLSKPRATSRSRSCRAPHAGQKCPNCGKGKLDYDGLLQLSCPYCGHLASGGGFT